MSFSFGVKGNSKAEALEAIKSEMAKVAESQPVHERDRSAVIQTAELFIGMLVEPNEGQEVSASVSGSLGWRGAQEEKTFTSANVNISASVSAKAN